MYDNAARRRGKRKVRTGGISMKRKTMDGNEAAAYASYAFTEVATI